MTVEPSSRQELVDRVAGLLSTIEFRPSEGHPIALDLYADQIVSMCDTRLRAIAGGWNVYQRCVEHTTGTDLSDALTEEGDNDA